MNYDYEDFMMASMMDATGDDKESERVRVVPYPFGGFIVYVMLSEGGEFLGISEIKTSAQFLSSRQKLDRLDYLDVEEFYQD